MNDAAAANTTMMGVVHDALRRDLVRLRTVTDSTQLSARQRPAVATHAIWMMDFLHRHHSSEDNGLWPLVRAKNAAAGPLLDQMDAEHQVIGPVVERFRSAATAYEVDGNQAASTEFLDALDALCAVLLPHLAHEEDEAMPVVSASITDADWRAWDQQYNIRSKSLRQLAIEAHWVADGLDRARYDHLVHLVPAPVRWVILKGFARSYRAAAATRWGADVPVGPLPR